MAEAVAVVGAGAGVVAAVAGVCQAINAVQKGKSKPSKDLETIHANMNGARILLCSKRDHHEDMLKRFSARKRRTITYSSWIDWVGKIEVEVDRINEKYEEYKKQKSRKSKISFKKLKGSELGSEMEIKTEAVRQLYEVGTQLEDILVEKEPEPIVKMKAPDITEFSTLQKPMEDILAFLLNDKVKGIRVRGLVGTGKTAIMQNLNNHEKVAEVFELVMWVNVSTDKDWENLSTRQLQQALVRRLKLNVEGSSDVNEVACVIREELRDKKYLLLLDDVKEDLELDQIGIDLNDENGSKVVLTTTVDGVCNLIVDRVIEVKKLSPGEAWKMFKNVVSQNLNHRSVDSRIVSIMRRIVTYCDGLPLVIKTVANAFKMRDGVQSWSDGLDRLILWPEKQDDAMKRLYKKLNFCSAQLMGAQKDCFFHSAIYPDDSDIDIDCLFDCWAAEDLYGEIDDAKKVRAYGPVVLEDLKKVSLLEEGVSKQHVTMHKLIRRAALFKLSADGEHKHLVKTGESLLEPPNAKHWEEKKWISLADNELQTLPKSPNCSLLSTLFLQKNQHLRTIPNLFFEHMENLRVLNMDCTRIVSLPSSLSKLIRLKVLYLNGCTDLGLHPCKIEELENVEVIDMRGTRVQKIPEEIKNLRLLRRLLVSFSNFGCHDDPEIVSHNCTVISNISTLEELIIDVKSDKRLCNEMQNDVIDKIAATLKKLTTFKFCFEGGIEDDVIKVVAGIATFSVPTVDALASFVQRIDTLSSMSKPFQVFVGSSSSTPPQIPNFHLFDRYLRYCNGSDCTSSILKVLAETEAFELVKHTGLEHVSDFGTANLDKVRGCLIEDCHQIRAIADKVDGPLLPNLEELYVKMLPVLESVWKVSMPFGSLNKLRTLKIEKCSQIKELFVEAGNNATVYRDFLPNLKTLILADMPNLRRICVYGSLEWPSLEKLQIDGCPSLKRLPFNKDDAKKLNSIEAEQIWWDALTWQYLEVKERLQPHCSLR